MRWRRLIRYIWMALMMPVFTNLPLIFAGYRQSMADNPELISYLIPAIAGGYIFISWLVVNIMPYRPASTRRGDLKHRTSYKPGPRLIIMRGGCTLAVYALYGMVIQCMTALVVYPRVLAGQPGNGIGRTALLGYAVYSVVICFVLLWNGILRMFLLSVRLRIGTRILMLLAMWIPVVNLLVLLFARKQVLAEYDFACYKESVRLVRAESDLCKTRYPLVMVHGIGFRDLKYFNYWGRIPRELTRYGAVVYYGNQEAMGTIAYNAGDICEKIRAVLAETGCEKVNIIAHSKGGLDARYAISQLAIGDCVASLTTINTPHHGCRFVDYACGLPEGLYRLVARIFDRTFRTFGDRNPDFYTATRQFSTASSQQFNQEVPDHPGVYYQSYTSVMRDAFSDLLLWFPYLLIYPLEGANDGLVSLESARWGEFRTVFKSERHRGISHGDIIDLKREDYKGFDVVECFVGIVSDLKEKGF